MPLGNPTQYPSMPYHKPLEHPIAAREDSPGLCGPTPGVDHPSGCLTGFYTIVGARRSNIRACQRFRLDEEVGSLRV